MLTTLLASQLFLFIIVFAHELGHYFTARAVGIPVESFTVGIGPAFTVFTIKGTPFRIAPLLLGGYVKFDADSYQDESPFKRLLICLGGPLAGVLFSLVPLLVLGLAICHQPVVQAISSSLHAMSYILRDALGIPAHLFTSLYHQFLPAPAAVGVHPASVGRISDNYTFMQGADIKYYLISMAMGSTFLSALNLIPIPPLDGGHALLNIVELVLRRKLPLWAKLTPSLVGIALFLLIISGSIYNDLKTLF